MSTFARAMLAELRPQRSRLMWGLLLLLVTNGVDKTIPWLLKLAVDALRQARWAEVTTYAIGAVAAALLMWPIRALSRVVIFRIGREIERELRERIMQKVHATSWGDLVAFRIGDVMSRATNDVSQIRLLYGFGLLNGINTLLAYVTALTLMFVLSPELTLYALAPFPVFAGLATLFSTMMFARSSVTQRALGGLSTELQEVFSHLKFLRLNHAERWVTQRFHDRNRTLLKANMSLALLRAGAWPALSTVTTFGGVLVLWKGGSMIAAGELSAGTFAAFAAYLAQLLWPTMALGFLVAIWQRGRASFLRIREFLDHRQTITCPTDTVVAPRGKGLRVEGLEHHMDGRPALKDVNFRLAPGESLAVMGPTGSGKSILGALLPRLLPTRQGTVWLGDQDITGIELASLRRTIGYVAQEPYVFSTTVERNLALALDDPDGVEAHEQVRDAARRVGLLDEVEGMARGFQTVVGPRGVQLSGGQRQRVALGRALLTDPDYLVLDDPLSAVDAPTEAAIISSLEAFRAHHGLIFITHRVHVAERFPRVLVLDRGAMVQLGSPEQLRKQRGTYRRLWESQRGHVP